MTTLRLSLSELKRLTNGRMAVVALIALLMVPLLYGALYLYANWDPYDNLDGLKAALVVEDKGAQLEGEQRNMGDEVAKQLRETNTVDWVPVDTAQEANDGVESGEYSFAMTIPADFSQRLASAENITTGEPAGRAMLEVTTNDANNYLLGTISSRITSEVRDTVAQQVSQQTADGLLTSFGTIHDQLTKAAGGAKDLQQGAQQTATGASDLRNGSTSLRTGSAELVEGQRQLVDATGQLSTGANQLSTGLQTLSEQSAALPEQTRALADGSAQVAAGNAQLNQSVHAALATLDAAPAKAEADAKAATDSLVERDVIDRQQADELLKALQAQAQETQTGQAAQEIRTASAQVQALADGSAQVAAGNKALADASPQLVGGINSARDGAATLNDGAAQLATAQQSALDGAQQLATGAAQLDDGAGQLKDGTTQVASGAGTLHSELASGAKQVPNPDEEQRANYADVLSDPLTIDTTNQAKAASYGAGMAPFFLTLALWIGIFALSQTMRAVNSRALASNAPAWKIALGGWLPFFLLSAIQGTLLFAVVQLVLGLHAAHPVLLWLLMLAASLAFSALIQGLIACFGAVGKYLVLVLMVLQLVGSGGTFPWQTAPEALQPLHRLLPMGHVVDGMRLLAYGGDAERVTMVFLGLLGYTLLGLLLSVVAVRRSKYWTLKTLQPQVEA